jgi:hypothetical protein
MQPTFWQFGFGKEKKLRVASRLLQEEEQKEGKNFQCNFYVTKR